MKNKFLKILSKPKIIIPTFFVFGFIVLIFSYNHIGVAPVVDVKNETISSNILPSTDSVSLSFGRGGKISDVLVKTGDKVYKGEVLAKLEAKDQEGVVSQTKSALDLAEAEYSLLNTQYNTLKKQQDLIVANAYKVLLSSGLEAYPDKQTTNEIILSGVYSCGKEGHYTISPYQSGDSDTGFSFKYEGLENGIASVKYDNPIALGSCGLQIKFKKIDYLDSNIDWTINIPNTKSSTYLANKNAYELAVENKDKALSDFMSNLSSIDGKTSVAKAKVEVARGNYQAALGAYENNVITAPIDGIVNFVYDNLKVGQSIIAGKNVISISGK